MSDFTRYLPPELIDKVLSYLNVKEIGFFSQVSVNWREASNRDSVWLHHCMKNGWMKYGISGSILHEEPSAKPTTNISGTSPHFDLYVPFDTRLSPICKWKHVYLRMYHLTRNWEKGRFFVSPTLRGHSQRVTAIDSNGTCLVSGSEDKTLVTWNMLTGSKIYTVRGHSDAVTAIKIQGHHIITGCADSAVRVFRIDNGDLEFSLFGHSGSVDHLGVSDHDYIISAGSDRTVRVWSSSERKLLRMFHAHTDEIECMHCCGHMILTCSWDKLMVLYHVENDNPIQVFEGHSEAVSCCQFDEYKVVSGSADSDLRIWETSSGYCTHVLEGHTGEVYCLVYNKHVIASGASDSTIRIWSHSGECQYVLTGHLGIVRCLYINDHRLVSGGDQKKIGIWNFKTGKLMNMVHRCPSLLHLMWVGETKIVTASPESTGTITIINFW
ncbi:F-box/WD repeat-containing protein 7-like [Mytilus californianus]|uniref:F-box/WD repeat-containing protein 7-like n=1 Tax=Mytilus californianus TaxID=6549 RepID=UPI0022465C17|nr:F-box/WD repeat-containing protein 7-like [Mytilus californianus]